MKCKYGVQESVWLSHEISRIAANTSKRLGMSKSHFYRYAILKTLEQLGDLKNQTGHEGGAS